MLQTAVDPADTQAVSYRSFFDGPTKGQWRRASIGRVQNGDGVATEVKVVPLSTLYLANLVIVDGGNGCFQHFSAPRQSWVRDLAGNRRDLVNNEQISWEEKN